MKTLAYSMLKILLTKFFNKLSVDVTVRDISMFQAIGFYEISIALM